MPAVVSDTSPLIYLTRIGRLDWLRVIYGDVVIPGEVWRELSEAGRGFPEFAAVQTYDQAIDRIGSDTPPDLHECRRAHFERAEKLICLTCVCACWASCSVRLR